MHLKKLRLAGFKSFVEPAELRIEPGLTAVGGRYRLLSATGEAHV